MVSIAKKRMRRVKVRTPGGRVVIHYRPRKKGKHHCALCGDVLHGVPHGARPVEVRKLSKSERRPERVFGGVLCASCTRRVVEEAFLVKTGKKAMDRVNLRERPFVEQALKVVGA